MKPLPNLDDDAAMLAAGKRSALYFARKEAHEALRDAHTAMQGADAARLLFHARIAVTASERLVTVALLVSELQDFGDDTKGAL